MTDKKEKILILTTTYPRWSGDSTPGFVEGLAKSLLPEFDVYVLAPHYKGASKMEVMHSIQVTRFKYAPERFERLCYDGGMISRLKHNRLLWLFVPFFILSASLHIYKALKKNEIRLVHCHWLLPLCPLIAVIKKLNIHKFKLAITIHGGDIFAFNKGVFRTLNKFSISAADTILPVSGAIKDVVSSELGRSEITKVISMGVDTSKFKPAPKLGNELSNNRLLFVGRLVEKKGLEVLIQSLKELHDHGHVMHLDILGDGPLKNDYIAMASKLNLEKYIRFYGWVDQVRLPEFYQRAGIVVMPSVVAEGGDSEGLGLVAVEAILCGAIVVASDLAPIKDVIEDGKNGFLFATADSHSLFKVLTQVYDNYDAIKIDVAKAIGETVAKFGWDTIGKKHINEFLYLLEK